MAQQHAQRRLAAILAADVAGYSRLMGADEEGTLAALMAHRAELLEPSVAEHRGRIVKTTGDGFLVEFTSVVDAVRCAVALQAGMADRNAATPAERRIEFRIGINLGDVIVENGDVFGDGVNIAARLEQIAAPGGICLSEDAYRQVRGKLELGVVDAGAQRLKNIASPIRVYRIEARRIETRPGTAPAGRGAVRRRLVPALLGSAVAITAAAAGSWYWFGRDVAQAPPVGPVAARAFPIVAVLPFANQTGDAAQEYFADGVTEEVINALGRFNTLRVIGRNAVLAYKGRPPTRDQISSELGADYLVEGSVRRSERRVRIAGQLSSARDGTVLWTDRYDGELADVFDFQDAIARQISGTLAANITQIEARRSLDQKRPLEDAHDLVLRARATGFASSRAANRQFRELITRAIELDPRYASAHALLAESLYSQAILGWTESPDRELSRGEDFARRAIASAPDEPDGYRVLGRIHVARIEYEQARNALARAIELNPSDASALAAWGSVQAFMGELAGAIESHELALKYDPTLEPNYVLDLSVSYYLARRNDDALRIAERGMSRYPDFPMFNVPAAAAAARLGGAGRAARYVAEIRQRLPFLDLAALGSRYREPAHAAYLKEGLEQAGL